MLTKFILPANIIVDDAIRFVTSNSKVSIVQEVLQRH
jgi:hypothetical protein